MKLQKNDLIRLSRRLLFPGIALLAVFLMPNAARSDDETAPRRPVTLAERQLQDLVKEEEEIVSDSRREDGSYDEEFLQQRFQDLVNRYDRFIGEHPAMPAGYVAYGRLLERIGEERAAYSMYLKANELEPNIPFVKNQLGNHLAEEGAFDQALAYFLSATELDPDEPLYHYQIGNLLHHYRDEFLAKEIFSRELLDEKMLDAFAEAAKLEPDNIAYSYRHAEAYYDLEEPRWDEALAEWEKIRKTVKSGIERQTIDLHKANIALKRGDIETAKKLLETVDAPALRQNRQTLLAKLEENTDEDPEN